MRVVTDIDLDFADRDGALEDLMHVPASLVDNGKLKRHNVGVYFHQIPQDPVTGLASIEYKTAETRGYFKIDFLNVSVYKGVRDEAHLLELIERDPPWEMLDEEAIVDELFHLNGHFDIVSKMQPRSVEQIAMVLALIRPAKRHLVGKDWVDIEPTIWDVPEGDAYYFKKAHAFSYAMAIIVQMNLMLEQASALPDETVHVDEKAV